MTGFDVPASLANQPTSASVDSKVSSMAPPVPGARPMNGVSALRVVSRSTSSWSPLTDEFVVVTKDEVR